MARSKRRNPAPPPPAWATGPSSPAGSARPEVEAYLRQADILTLPSYDENLPMSVIEGMAAGLPVVTTPWAPPRTSSPRM